MKTTLVALLLLALFVASCEAVTRGAFKTCDQNSFCKRNRHYADQVAHLQSFSNPYEVTKVSIGKGEASVSIVKSVPKAKSVPLSLKLSVLASGGVRVTLDEPNRAKINNVVSSKRYDASHWAFNGEPAIDTSAQITDYEHTIEAIYGDKTKAVLNKKTLQLDVYRNDKLEVSVNKRHLLNMEHLRSESDNDKHLSSYEIADGMFKEEFGGHPDSKPKGPESVALDFEFPGYNHVYGIPEHADRLSLRSTRGRSEGDHTEPYRLYNVDILEYETDSPMPMYGAIPFLQARKPGSSAGVFWVNAADTYIDIQKEASHTDTHWISESGTLDFIVFVGKTPEDIVTQYGSITGFTTLPPISATAYHQCRWNYNTQDDVLEVHANFDKYDIPYDTIWLDVEYTQAKKYFTWNRDVFPDPGYMLGQLDKTCRKLTVIIDPHIKLEEGYKVYDALKQKGLYVKSNSGDAYEGDCWPGKSVWIDTTNPAAAEFWKSMHAKEPQGIAAEADNMFFWNDMNEPSVFNGPETSILRDTVHYGGYENRDVHNAFGMSMINATFAALTARNPAVRPFILTRSFFSGTQRTAAMWTGDNEASWEYLQIATPMVLTQNVAGMPFAGADVGGFFGNPAPELLTRWYQAGLFYPFFRAHAHIDTKRREPWLAEEEHIDYLRNAIRLRYQLLPSIYTAFRQASVSGAPILKPLFYVAPNNPDAYARDDSFFVGNTGLLVHPVVHEGATSVNMFIPDEEVYYDFHSSQLVHKKNDKGFELEYKANIDTIPILQRGGHIYARRDRIRRSSELMLMDPVTLVVNANSMWDAEGELYLDDGKGYGYKNGDFIHMKFNFDGQVLKASSLNPDPKSFDFVHKAIDIPIEKIIVNSPEMLTVGCTVRQAGRDWNPKYETKQIGATHQTIIHNPGLAVGLPWAMSFS
ncbi:glycosyl hydrolases family 31-domain-containing protein [Yarrowia lipolytica]|jgi:alpha 1,3-glucosidase|uniref:Glucosidase II subunit alpha n=2 Tax=Yarrowia lipolytica TaxID=4952 RepID=Q6CFI8_YARLI|nr:YALI0B06600p [Yarrowia lipolytica CLIB122]AOW01317.1 hypothetical protein YALI1_B08650g [Yarrowia lipolytica]KAB8285401.1 glycosyl hydrolases family 31-domain-containing protein [Yarrowia lipolytica]KAE8169290.1 glycosyl hydrolases family 31-domain-containing protein [Yarrowia lipolytica]KAJ8052176.1 glycosyl hydrolases family 31-domain-containing protein [Yarrowia lipolytica]QNP96594.1 Glucosidase 2 subunit alpha [Yarrowia lipolytica]|eukprot:XP_500574.1 YALI0B06600p [Yarrowia lipolytica CLIB122]